MIKGVFLPPVQDNDGRSLRQEILAATDAVFDQFGGWTRDGRVIGKFRMASGSPQRDVCEKYTVIFEESGLEALRGILLEFKGKTSQEAIYLEVLRQVEFYLV